MYILYKRDCNEKNNHAFCFFIKKKMFFCVENSLKNASKNSKKHEIFQKREKLGSFSH